MLSRILSKTGIFCVISNSGCSTICLSWSNDDEDDETSFIWSALPPDAFGVEAPTGPTTGLLPERSGRSCSLLFNQRDFNLKPPDLLLFDANMANRSTQSVPRSYLRPLASSLLKPSVKEPVRQAGAHSCTWGRTKQSNRWEQGRTPRVRKTPNNLPIKRDEYYVWPSIFRLPQKTVTKF